MFQGIIVRMYWRDTDRHKLPHFHAYYGEDVEYPKSTAFVQTTDTEKTNIYNSFDSFVQNVITVNFKITGTTLRSDDVQYFNLNSDIGFLP